MRSTSLGCSAAGSPIPLVPRPSVRRCTSLRPMGVKQFTPPTDETSPFRLPKSVRKAACVALSPYRSRDAAFRLLSFLARFWTHPTRLDRSWPVDRRGLANHRLLGLTEGEVRGALRTLEKAGVVVREPMERRHAYRPTEQGLRRSPIMWRFAVPFLTMFRMVNRWKAIRDQRVERQGKGEPSQPKHKSSENLTPKVMLTGLVERVSDKAAIADPTSPLEMALASWGRAILRT